MTKVLIPIADGTEEMEAVTLIDLLRRAQFDVTVASVMGRAEVVASRGVKLTADTTIEQCADHSWDMVALAGGMPGAEHLAENATLKTLLQRQARDRKWLAAICASPAVVLGPLGLLNGRKATGYPAFCEQLTGFAEEVRDDTVVIDGKLITSRGPGTASDFALAAIEALAGKTLRDQVAEEALLT